MQIFYLTEYGEVYSKGKNLQYKGMKGTMRRGFPEEEIF